MRNPKTVLKDFFGYDSFRPGQEKIINLALSGKNALAIMPTGGGKSLCYQIPALVMDGVTLVISPLISLMKDQIDTLRQNGIAAAALNSTTPQEEVNPILRRAYEGKLKLLYVTPERLALDYFRYQLNFLNISLVAVDEAHCISQWGHDFRPAYRQILAGINGLKSQPNILALTATATPAVQKDIGEQLEIPTSNYVITSFARPNLAFTVENGVRDSKRYILRYIQQHPDQAGIVYTNTRKRVEEINEYLSIKGIKVAGYHGGMSSEKRSQVQDDFLYDRVQVIVATNAFGMGIDKSNVRFVIHANSAKNIEAYYQEAGRAGRDGDDCEAIFLYHPGDMHQYRWFIDESDADDDYKKRQYRKLAAISAYANTDQCLQQFIVRYFGQDCDPCGHCSNCKLRGKLLDVTADAQKIIQMIYELDGRFGKSVIAQAVTGSTTMRMREIGANEMKHFGSLKTSQQYASDLINYLVANEFLESDGNPYPILHVTNKGWDVLDGKKKVQRRELRKRAVSQKGARVDEVQNADLFAALRSKRWELARKEGVPAFMIFSDATLKMMAQLKPKNEAAMLAINGIGKTKMRRFGKEMLAVINEN
ncbi:DNA helicase RecQ [Lactobacillus sp. PV034]|uniref:DNA helicase RecQ n=1 Tax=Lactobacillus sp. PV034 TaxID=2594495 RepID=UPI00223F4ACC|nr:DNA helicase RecQ [Lactobacillus sp. PV034]QNQ80560.1 DNA helicase RecQ [Lactobacillus sp. PV034]